METDQSRREPNESSPGRSAGNGAKRHGRPVRGDRSVPCLAGGLTSVSSHRSSRPGRITFENATHHLAMIADQRSLLFPFDTGYGHHAQSFILASEIAIEAIDQLCTIAPIGLLPLTSLAHRLGRYHQVLDAKSRQLTI